MKSAILLALSLAGVCFSQSLKYSHFVPGHNVVFSTKETSMKDHFSRETYLKDTTHNGSQWAVIRTCSIANKDDSCDASRSSLVLTRESPATESNPKVAWRYYLDPGAEIDSNTIFLDDTVLQSESRKVNLLKEATCNVDGRVFNDCFHIFLESSDSMFYEVYMSASEGLLRKEQHNGSRYNFLAQRVFSEASTTKPRVRAMPLHHQIYRANGRHAQSTDKPWLKLSVEN
ncbi:MAG: hypothetical protein IPN71_04635 [Fibrobacteres bacterium]|nr:hypothetical protein [Fibrobacterota bacterium]